MEPEIRKNFPLSKLEKLLNLKKNIKAKGFIHVCDSITQKRHMYLDKTLHIDRLLSRIACVFNPKIVVLLWDEHDTTTTVGKSHFGTNGLAQPD